MENTPTKPTLPYAPVAHEGYKTTPQTEEERNSGLLSKLRLGKLALVGAAIEASAAVAAAATHEPALLALGPVALAGVAGEALYSAHNYFRNGFRPTAPINRLIKAKTLEK